MCNEEANNVKKVASTFLIKRAKKVASTFLGPLLGFLLPVTCFLIPVTSHADLLPGRGSIKSASSASLALPLKTSSSAITLFTPADGATDVSQSPSLNVVSNYPTGAGVQYHIQVNTTPDMTSPQGNFNQNLASVFASSGAFSGGNATISVTNDAFSAVSTATFAFYSSSAKLNANTVYYWRARVKPSGSVYSAWSGTASFTTGTFAVASPANNLAISGVTMSGVTNPGRATISFNIAENNVSTGTSTNGGAYNTADWIFVKFSTAAGADGTWQHATLIGGTVGTGATLAAASDNKGVYLNHTINSAYWTSGVNVTWNLAADGVLFAKTYFKVFAISMVKVPAGTFYYNVENLDGVKYNNYGNGSQKIVDGPGIATGNGLTNNLPLNAPVGWPNGYNSFYIGRYEITTGQYADFLNNIPSTLASTLYYASNMTNAGYPDKYTAVNPNAPKNYLSVDEAWRYLSWAGLRPPTEMEFEKAGRDLYPDARIYPWGSSTAGETYTPPNEGGTFKKYFINFNTGGINDVGRYMSGDVYRTPEQTGASPWGIADLGSNVMERVVTCAWVTTPLNGDGTPTFPATWPTDGNNYRGGAILGDVWYYSKISQRYWINSIYSGHANGTGARPARTP